MSTSPSMPRRPSGPPRPAQGGAAPTMSIDPMKLLLKYKWVLVGAAIAGVIIGVASHLVLARTYPIYSAEVYFECESPSGEVATIDAVDIDKDEIEKFMGTQVDRMKSKQVLSAVVRDPRLAQEAPQWYKRYVRGGRLDSITALDDLEDMVRSAAVPNTYLIRLSVNSRYNEDAAGIVRLVRENYLSQLQQQSNSNIIERKKVIRDAMEDTEQAIDELNARRSRLVRDQGVDSLDGVRTQRSESLNYINQQLVGIQGGIEALTVSLQADEAQLERSAGIEYNSTLRAEVEQSPLMLNLKQQLNSFESALAAIRIRKGPEHREYKQLTAQIEGLKSQIDQTREAQLREAFESRVDQTRLTIDQYRAQEADLLSQAEVLQAELIDLTRIVGEITDIDRQIEQSIAQLSGHQSSLAEITATASLSTAARVSVAQAETVPDLPVFPKIFIMVPLGMVLITGLVTGLVVVIELLDKRIKSAADVASGGRVPVLGIIPDASEDPSSPEHPESVFRDTPGSVLSEHYRQLRTKIGKIMQREGHKTLLVVGAMPESGATSVVSNLGSALVASGHKTLVIDTNFRRPGLHAAMDAPAGPGLAEALEPNSDFAAQIHSAAGAPDLLAAGNSGSKLIERLGSERMGELLDWARDNYEFVLLDVAPVVVVGDAISLANRCDSTLLIVRAMQDKRGMVARLRNELSESRAEFLGVLVNGVRSAAGGYMRKNIRASARYLAGENTAA